jgi:hypothetical protein
MSAYETSLGDLFKAQASLDSAKASYQEFCDRVTLGAKTFPKDGATCTAYVAAKRSTEAAYLAFRATALLTNAGA